VYTVAFLAQKGGVGKTTLALTLAVQAELAGESSGVIDADPQATASGWALARARPRPEGQGKPSPPVAAAHDAATLRRAIQDAREDGLGWLFIDTPAGVSELPVTAAGLADLLLMPCVPSVFNMDALASTVKLVRHLNKPAFFLINRGRSKGINDECALALTSAYGLPATNAHISHRLPIADAEQSGAALVESLSKDSSVEKGKDEFRALWKWLKAQAKNAR
jgi:chromosome partitioning protein